MRIRRILAATTAAVMVSGGVSLAVAPTASAVDCPTVAPNGQVSPGLPYGSQYNDLSGCDLTGAYLERAPLRFGNLAGANLTGANLIGANLIGANLTGANLIGANLTGADLTMAFVYCSDTGVLGTGIKGAPSGFLPDDWQLTGGTLSVPVKACPRRGEIPASADVPCPTINPETGKFDPRPAPNLNWSACDLTRGDWRGANATGMTLYRTLWGWSDAKGALLRGANMSEVTFLGPVDLTGADLNGVDLTKADLRQAFVVSSGDTGNLGCGIKGDPRLLPHGWALTGPERCLKTKVNASGSGDAGSAAPHACGRMMIPKQSSRLLKSEAGQASVYARGMTCGEAISLVEEVTQDGAVTPDELQRRWGRLLAAPSQQQEDPSQQQEELWIATPVSDDHAAKAFMMRAMRVAIGWPRITISSETVEVHEDSLEKRLMKETLPICAPADRLGWRTGTCQPG